MVVRLANRVGWEEPGIAWTGRARLSAVFLARATHSFVWSIPANDTNNCDSTQNRPQNKAYLLVFVSGRGSAS
jgi:hypothetical protein